VCFANRVATRALLIAISPRAKLSETRKKNLCFCSLTVVYKWHQSK
jgi:hypothetical protein